MIFIILPRFKNVFETLKLFLGQRKKFQYLLKTFLWPSNTIGIFYENFIWLLKIFRRSWNRTKKKNHIVFWWIWESSQVVWNLLKALIFFWRTWESSEGRENLWKVVGIFWNLWKFSEDCENLLKVVEIIIRIFWRLQESSESCKNLLKLMKIF